MHYRNCRDHYQRRFHQDRLRGVGGPEKGAQSEKETGNRPARRKRELSPGPEKDHGTGTVTRKLEIQGFLRIPLKKAKQTKEIQELKQGPYIEKIAREQLGMIKKDEIALIKIKKSSEGNSEVPEEKAKAAKKKISTLELCKKNIEDFFITLFHTISIKKQ